MEGMERVAIALVRAGADAKRENNAGHSSISLCSPYMASRLRAELDVIATERICVGHIDERLSEDVIRRIHAHSLGRQAP